MTRSMTGFAHRDLSGHPIRGSLALKSYNNRYLDLSVFLPPQFSSLEPRIRDYLQARIVHGKVELSLRVKQLDLPVTAKADLEAAKAVATVLRDIQEACGIEEPLRLGNLLSFDGVLSYERDLDEDGLWAALLPEIEALFLAYDESRLKEGEATRRDILGQLGRIEAGLETLKAAVPDIEKTVRTQLRQRFAEVLGEAAIDEGRILTELAALLMKYGINEELTRLAAHVASFKRILDAEEASGKKLDFLSQEMNREVNTIGSKNILLPVAEVVVELKDSLENIREQLRNIE